MKKAAKKKRAPKKAAKNSVVPYVVVAVIIVALIIGAVAYYFLSQKDVSDVAVTVNGKPILQTDIDFQYKLLPASYTETFTLDQVLEQIIDEELVVQAAERQGIVVTNEDVQARVQEVMSQNELTVKNLQENLDNLNITQEQFETLIRRQLIMDRFFNRTFTVTTPDDATLQALYDLSISQYSVPEQVTVRHVLISLERTDAALIAKQVYDDARAGADFCVLAANASDDRGSRDTCGQYTFPRGFMVPEFEEAAFTMSPGDVEMIQSRFGYHIIQKINMTPASVKPFIEVRDSLVDQFQSAEHAQEYRKLISELRSTATIVYANGTTILPQSAPSISAGVPEETTPPKEDAPVAPAVNQTLFTCVAEKSVLYGTSWNTDTQDARKLFANNGATLEYVACDKTACTDIKGYPTWKIDGKLYVGRMTLDELKNAASC